MSKITKRNFLNAQKANLQALSACTLLVVLTLFSSLAHSAPRASCSMVMGGRNAFEQRTRASIGTFEQLVELNLSTASMPEGTAKMLRLQNLSQKIHQYAQYIDPDISSRIKAASIARLRQSAGASGVSSGFSLGLEPQDRAEFDNEPQRLTRIETHHDAAGFQAKFMEPIGNDVLLVGEREFAIYSLDSKSRKTYWTFQGPIQSFALIDNDTMVVSRRGLLEVIRITDGEVLSSKRVGSLISSLVGSGASISAVRVFGIGQKYVGTWNEKSGSAIFTLPHLNQIPEGKKAPASASPEPPKTGAAMLSELSIDENLANRLPLRLSASRAVRWSNDHRSLVVLQEDGTTLVRIY